MSEIYDISVFFCVQYSDILLQMDGVCFYATDLVLSMSLPFCLMFDDCSYFCAWVSVKKLLIIFSAGIISSCVAVILMFVYVVLICT